MLEASITSSSLLLGATVLFAALVIYLLIRKTWKRVLASVIGFIVGGAIGLGVFWWLVDVNDVFGVTLSDFTRMWVVLGFAGLGLALVNLFRSRWWRKVIAILSIPIFLATAGLQVNADFGAYQNLNQVFGGSTYGKLTLVKGERGEVIKGMADYKAWKPPKDMPKNGKMGEVEIPGVKSGFPARKAIIWLPPAALVDHPPVLPVLFTLSGQPGEPTGNFSSGHIDVALDKYQKAHHGIAPILVAADQLSSPGVNPMCVNSKAFGNSATYITEDVPNYIKKHYRVSEDPRMWGITGFSQGGTCVSQFVTEYPHIFGSGIASLSQIGPRLNSIPDSIRLGFDGSKAKWEAAQPIAIMQKHGRYRDTMLYFGTGVQDQRYTGFAHQLNAAATAAGITSELMIEPTGHDWHTVQSVFDRSFPDMARRMGIDLT